MDSKVYCTLDETEKYHIDLCETFIRFMKPKCSFTHYNFDVDQARGKLDSPKMRV